jgi:dipeptidyl-peptidase-4
MAEAVNGLRSNLAVKNITKPSWISGKNAFVQVQKNSYLITEIPSMKVDTLVSLTQINKNFAQEKTLKELPEITFTDTKNGYYKTDSTYYKIEKSGKDWKVKNWISIPNDAENINVLDGNNTIVYTLKNNLYLNKNGKITAITNDKDENIVNGQSVHRNEFGIDKGIFISPDKNKIAFYRMDQTMVADYPVIDWSVTPAENHNIKYPMAGGISHQVSLGIFDLKNFTKIFLKINGDKEQYLTCVTWSPDNKYVLVGVLNRDQNDLNMNVYDAVSGDFVKNIFEEKNEKYVHPTNALRFFPDSNEDFIYQSEKDGYNHLYHYNITQGFVNQLTKGNWVVTSLLGFNEKKKEVYFASTKETPLEKHLYKVNWENQEITRLDDDSGVHNGILSPNSEFIYDTFSSSENPRKVDIINTKTGKIENILTAENPLKNYERPEIQNVTIKADDGTPLYGKLILPTDFNASEKYPVIVYLYNGPNVQLITNSFPASGNLWYEYMAQRGYIIFTMDGRGSDNRGFDFESATFRNLGTVEMNDQLKGVEYLKSLPYVDAQRMGVHGWSFGGFMTTSLMLRHPEVFKVGVAGGPVIDWKMYEIMYTERYMDTPQTNPEGYEQANLLDKIQNLKGKLLIIHGAQDDTVVWQHSIKLLKAAVDNGIQLDYFVYPGHPHNVIGKDRVHLMQKITDYFDEYLKK